MLHSGSQQRRSAVVVLGGAAALVLVAVVWGRHLQPSGILNVHAAPFQGHYRFAPRVLVPAGVYAVLGVITLPVLSRRLPWRLLIPVSALAAAGWAMALAVWDGHQSLGGPLGRAHEYLPALARIGEDPLGFLSRFADDVAHRRLPVHVNGHPPLMVLVFWAWDRLGGTGTGWAAALVIAVGASSVAALAMVVRDLGDEHASRRVIPFLVLGPFAVTVATSADSFFLGVSAWAAAALAAGIRRRSWPLLLVAGLLTGALPYLSYGLLPFGAVLLAVAWLAVRRQGPPGERPRTVAQLAVALLLGAIVVPLAFSAAGFWWFEGAAATHRAWRLGRGDDRPYAYSLVADLAILAVLVGPATVVAVTRRPARVPAVLAGASLVALLVLAVAGITRLEVERIWLPFAPWLVLLTAALPRRSRGWLLLNAGGAIAFQVLVLDVW